MSVLTNVFRRSGVFYFRASVPKGLRAIVGRRDLWKSLRTNEPGLARQRGIWALALTESLWRDLQRPMSADEIKQLVAAWTKAQIDGDADARLTLPGLELEAYDSAQREEFAGAVLRRSNEFFDPSFAKRHVDELLHDRGLTLDATEHEIAVRLMMGAHVHVFRAINLRREKKWRPWIDPDPAAAIAQMADEAALSAPLLVPAAPSTARSFGRLSEVGRAAISDLARTKGIAPRRISEFEAAIAMLKFALDADVDLSQVTRDVAGTFMRDLTRYPVNATKRKPYRDLLTFRERVDTAMELGEKRVLKAETINGNYLTPLRIIWDWQKAEKGDLLNPFKDMRAEAPRRADASRKRRDFQNDEIIRLFSQPLFRGAETSSQAGLYRPGTIKIDDWRFWVPLICFFSGMRLNEACGLAVADIRQADGIDYFHVRDDLEGQSLKTAAARRKVPIHNELAAVGLLNFVERRRASGSLRLFEDLRADTKGHFSDVPSKFFARLIDRIENPDPDEPGTLVFHSTRHTVTTRLRAADVRIDFAKEIVGHEQGEVHGGYGSFPLPEIRDSVNKIRYPGLDLSHIVRP